MAKEELRVDIAIVGNGPAGWSCAMTARMRGLGTVVIAPAGAGGWLSGAERIDNYPGLPQVSGKELLERFRQQALALGAEEKSALVRQIMPNGERFLLLAENDVLEAKAVVLCMGAARPVLLPGEEELLGSCVSYCATCDGMFYRGKPVVVIGRAADAPEEANYLQGIGCQVTYVAPRVRPAELLEEIPFYAAPRPAILGEDRVTGVQAGGELIPCDGVFILRETIAPARLIDGLEMEGTFIAVDRLMHTNIPGLFAAGDCTGKPLQVSKAVGEGLIAAQEAARYVDGRGEA